MLTFNSNVLKFNGLWLGFTTPPQPTIYRINVPTVQHGTATVYPTEGPTGTLVTISVVPDTGYELDTISLTGAELINGNQFYIDGSDVTVNVTYASTSVLPANTIRLKFTPGATPEEPWAGTLTLVDSTNNIWDYTYENPNWQAVMYHQPELLEVIGGNVSGVRDMAYTFSECQKLTKVPLLNYDSLTRTWNMFAYDTALTEIPAGLAYLMPNVTRVTDTFRSCTNVQSGMLEFYNVMKNQVIEEEIPGIGTTTSDCFTYCGTNGGATAAAERAQIPTTWGGDMS